MTKKLSLLLILLVLPIAFYAQTSISAKVIDADTQKPIPYLTVKYADGKGVITNDEGDFTINYDTPFKETDSIELSFMGYEKRSIPILGFNEETIALKEEALELDAVLLTDKKLPVEEIISRIKNNLQKNYNGGYTKNRFFLRETFRQYYKRFDFGFKKSSIKELTREFIDSLANSIPKRMAFYNETLGDFYDRNFSEDSTKLTILKTSKLYNKNIELSFEEVIKKVMKVLNENVKRDSYLKVRSGIVGTKLEVDSIVNEVKNAEKNQKENEKRYYFRNRKRRISTLLNELFFDPKSEINVIQKSNKYDFVQKGVVEIGDDLAYVVHFSPSGSVDFSGKLYVNVEDFAILRLDYENADNIYDKKFNMFGINANHIRYEGTMHFSKFNNSHYRLQYAQHKDLQSFKIDRPLAIIEKNKNVKGRRKQNELKLQMLFNLISNVTYDLVIFDSEKVSKPQMKAVKENKDIPVKYFSKYNPDYWKGYNIIEPNEAIRSFTTEGE